MPSSLPVLILTGYLGSGKTTVLNHFLATGGARIGVIINDFGDVNVDAALVAGHVAEPVSIAGGCLCCIEDPPASVHRIKAIVDVAAGRGIRRFVAHSVAGYVSVDRVPRPSDEPARSRVVAIGLECDDAALRRRLDALVRPDGAPAATARELRRLTRFL